MLYKLQVNYSAITKLPVLVNILTLPNIVLVDSLARNSLALITRFEEIGYMILYCNSIKSYYVW